MPGSGSSDGSTGGLTAALGTGLQAGAAAATQPSSDAGMTAAGHACSDRSAGADGHVPGASSPNKRKRSEQQQGSKAAARKAAGKTLTRFKPTYRDVADSVGAFDLDLLGRIHHSRVYVLTTVRMLSAHHLPRTLLERCLLCARCKSCRQLAQFLSTFPPCLPPRTLTPQRNLAALFMDKTHAQLDSKQGPYTSLAAAHPGLDLPALLCRFQCGRQYLEVSASFASPDPARFEACAPVVFSKQARSGGSDADLWVDSSLLDAAPAELLDDYYAGVRELIKTGKGQPAPPSGLLHVSFRLGSAALPAGAAAPWVQYAWQCDPAVCELLHNEAAEFVK